MMIHIPNEIKNHYLAAVNELENPEIEFTHEVIKNIGIDKINDSYYCDRFVEQDYSYLFYFRTKGYNFYYRILVMKEDMMVYSSKIVSGNVGKIVIKNVHNQRTHEQWIQFFNSKVNFEIDGKNTLIRINECSAYSINEVIELIDDCIIEKTKSQFIDYSLENDCILQIDSYISEKYKESIEIEKWNIIGLAKYKFGLMINYHLE